MACSRFRSRILLARSSSVTALLLPAVPLLPRVSPEDIEDEVVAPWVGGLPPAVLLPGGGGFGCMFESALVAVAAFFLPPLPPGRKVDAADRPVWLVLVLASSAEESFFAWVPDDVGSVLPPLVLPALTLGTTTVPALAVAAALGFDAFWAAA